MKKNLNILICPLEWGLGHAARMIPVASRLTAMGHRVFIGSGKEHSELFRKEIPGLSYIHFRGFRPWYSGFLPQYIVLLLQVPQLLYHTIREHISLRKIIRENSLDIVMSDNRFGLWNRNIRTCYVTHMPRIPFPYPFRFLEGIGIILHRLVIRQYSFCLIPDLPGSINLSGRLSHNIGLPENVRYTGILSRFTEPEGCIPDKMQPGKHNLLILSGPEPQRTILGAKAIEILKMESRPAIVLEGKPGRHDDCARHDNIIHYSHLVTKEMRKAIIESDIIISRAGYSTLMDLACLGCRALLVPTPGQTEQEYLAAYLSEKGWFSSVNQRQLSAVNRLTHSGVPIPEDINRQSRILLEKVLGELLE